MSGGNGVNGELIAFVPAFGYRDGLDGLDRADGSKGDAELTGLDWIWPAIGVAFVAVVSVGSAASFIASGGNEALAEGLAAGWNRKGAGPMKAK